MTTIHTSHDSRDSSTNDNLETFSLFWLDTSVNTCQENIDAQWKLRSIINYLKTFDDAYACEGRIQSLYEDDRLVLIVSGKLAREFVPRIAHLRQVSSIYVYYLTDEKENKEWTHRFDKIKLVTTSLDELIADIDCYGQSQKKNHDEPLSFSISDRSTEAIAGTFLHSQLLIDVLIRMESSITEMGELFYLIASEYSGNETELDHLREFTSDYQAEKAVRWYSRDTCIYRLLNKALRVKNPHVLFTFRFFMRDLQQQLEHHQCSSPVRVYRGQMVSKDEVNVLKNSIGKLISINSFLSTSIDRQVSIGFLESSNSLERILFEIDASPHLVIKKPFANIQNLSCYNTEDEVLFMLGSIFRINDISCQNDGVWVIKLSLCSDDDHDLKDLFDHMNKEFSGKNLTLLSFGDVLRRMGKFDDAEKYYHRYLKELSPGHQDVAKCYQSLGDVALDKKDYDSSLKWLYKALYLYDSVLNPILVADTHSTIALLYYSNDDYTQALQSYNRALMIYRQEFDDDHRKTAICFDGVGAVYGKMKKYSEALKFKAQALRIWEKELPADHPDLGQSHTCIGNTRSALDQFDLAMGHFNRSLTIYENSLPPEHPRVGLTLKSMGMVYEKKGEFKEALSYYKKAASIYHHLFPSNHSDVIDIEAKINNLSK